MFGQAKIALVPDPLEQQFKSYKLSKPEGILFVHFDKNIYTNSEAVWFTGYLLKEHPDSVSKHNILHVALVRDIDSTIIKRQKYIMADGLSSGSMRLPDTIHTGSYHFLVTTNRVRNGIPVMSFIQPITLKTTINIPFLARVREPDLGQKPTTLKLTVTDPETNFLPKPVDVEYRYGKIVEKTKTTKSGSLTITLPEQEDLDDPTVFLKLTYGNDNSFLNLPIAIPLQKAKVNFYPEGGNLVNGISGTVGWEAKDQRRSVMEVEALLFQNGQLIDTIQTNSYGIGRFVLKPQAGSIYQVRLLHSGLVDSLYTLPVAIDGLGVGLAVSQAVVSDTVLIKLKALQETTVYIRLHNFQETFLYNEVHLKNPGLTIKMPLSQVPKGLNTITLSDSQGRPIAERLFFAHYDPSHKLDIGTDQISYGQREKVNLSLKFTNADSLAKGLVSIACVQDARISHKLSSDIESYAYLNSQLRSLPFYGATRGYEDSDYLENILLVKGWSRYSWTDLMKVNAIDTLIKYDNTALSMRVSHEKDSIVKPIQLAMLNSKGLEFLSTDEHGNFEFPPSSLVVNREMPAYVFIGEKDSQKYRIKVHDPYPELHKGYLKVLAPQIRSVSSMVENNQKLSLSGNEGGIQLQDAVVNHRARDLTGLRGANACGDYVCENNILNCPNHRGGPLITQPIPGKSYLNARTQSQEVYKACTEPTIFPGMMPVEGIYAEKEFYLNDYADPMEPAFASTLYWNKGEMLNNKTKEISFHTSDITGTFRVIVQGVGTDGILYGDYSFEVKKK